jgi:hypothetical protein
MVTRILRKVLLSAALLLFVFSSVAQASYCAPNACPPPQVVTRGPIMSMPAPPMAPMPCGPPMSCAPAMNCPPPCPPPCPTVCGPSMNGFNPLSAIFSVLTLPFRLISARANYQPAMCAPPCMPMPVPECGPQPISKVKPTAKRAPTRTWRPMGQY